jgi:hypothetical protein
LGLEEKERPGSTSFPGSLILYANWNDSGFKYHQSFIKARYIQRHGHVIWYQSVSSTWRIFLVSLIVKSRDDATRSTQLERFSCSYYDAAYISCW